MKPATQILTLIVSVLAGGFVLALISRAKELMAAFVKATFGLIITGLVVIAIYENFGWAPFKQIGITIVTWVGMVIGGLLVVILGLAAIARLWAYFQEKMAARQQAQVTVK